MKKDIITFGAGAEDIYLILNDFSKFGGEKRVLKSGYCLRLGSKIDFDNILFRTGGGGTNTAATFKNQGFDVAWCGMIGKDEAGERVINDLKKRGVDVSLVSRSGKKPTNHSVILASPGKDRTIIIYRGASGEYSKKDIPWSRLKSKWFYIAPLSGKTALLTESLVDFAKRNDVKVALNPGSSQLFLPKAQLKRILKKVDVLILNRFEAASLTEVSYQKEKEVFKKIDELVPGICIMTKGKDGVSVSDGKYVYSAKSLQLKFVDSTGAGDAFGSGFVAGFIKTKDVVFSIQIGMANSCLNLGEWGAKEGLLKKNQSYPKVKIKKIPLK